MPNRRDFFKSIGGATAGVLTLKPRFADPRVAVQQRDQAASRVATPGTRKEVIIGGRRVKVVDVHAHCMVPEVLEVVKNTPLERVASAVVGSGRAAASVGGGNQVLGADRLQAMNERGIDIQVLSINGYWWYAADRDLARRIVKAHDDALAAWCASHRDRFVALTSPALQHPELAAEQLERAVKELGMRGASVGGHVEGESLSSPRFDPFWAKAQELGVLIFMHPREATNVIREGALQGRGDLGNIIGNPLETTVFLSRLIFDGTLDRFPGLKICAAHAGGYLPSYLGRTDVACGLRANANCANKKQPRDYFKQQLTIDSMIFSEEGLRHIVAEVGANQIMYGTDIPFNWPDSVDTIVRAPFLKDAEKAAILGGNVMKLLRMSS